MFIDHAKGQFRQPGHAIADQIGCAAVPIRPERRVEQPFDRLFRHDVQGHDMRHVLPIRRQWRMDRAGSGGLNACFAK